METDLGIELVAISESCATDNQTLPIKTCGFYIVIRPSGV
jgi:hypothetical protein